MFTDAGGNTYRTKYGRDLKYSIVESSRRKTIALEVGESGLIVRIPSGTSKQAINAMLEQHSLWVLRQLSQFETDEGTSNAKHRMGGDTYYFAGKKYELDLVLTEIGFPPGEVRLTENALVLSVFPDLVEQDPALHITEPLAGWYSLQAEKILPGLVSHYSQKLGLAMPVVIIKDQKRRWGSCNSKGELRLNYRIVIPPLEVTEYIVAHEVCHLIELNHSARFWNTVEKVIPDYKRLRRLLKHWEPRMQI